MPTVYKDNTKYVHVHNIEIAQYIYKTAVVVNAGDYNRAGQYTIKK